MNLIVFLLFGLLVGAVARLLVPGRQPGGWVVSLLLGVAGAFLGGLLGRAMGLYREGESAGFIMAVLGSVLLVGLYNVMTRRRGILR
jgi:uncharacterized membrane protein YeaQ/YmgE (transglycosylase-associated protein family)